ncbi:uncharacterized protein TRUGW13939_10105 [Talaromyces rugulosus]|uniref:Uncharacterized protein n=1 Tax=Talaromyces rugulosus TaxID=121627 RepID=A0A7H8R9Y3_TALRU|nr:uncharacterized protein TRUGW13939_10105 [Talaromyces rugulosus]QKX62937.1 hypothetical protein TRUGW13939_10105 [Talaromyces rugulosus]
MASKSIVSKTLTGLSRPVHPPSMRIGIFRPTQSAYAKIWNRLSSTNASTTGDALHEYFAVVWNKQNVGLHTAKEENLKFADDQVQITFFGEMQIQAGSEQAGICFACQAPSEERVRLAILAHEEKFKGIWDIEKIDISALETVHTSDFEKE